MKADASDGSYVEKVIMGGVGRGDAVCGQEELFYKMTFEQRLVRK